jgi:hypothetical protein
MTTIYVSGKTLQNMPKRTDFDFYPTPLSVAQDALTYIPLTVNPTCILDPGAEGAACFDLVMGNPPYKYAEQFVRQAYRMLEPDGHLIMLLRMNFLEGIGRAHGLWRTHPLKQTVVCSRRVSFSGDGKTNATAYAYFIWQKGWKGDTRLLWSKAA